MKNILFVCTGNTCRSPMAMVYTNSAAKNYGLDLSADSAGVFADVDSGYSQNAVLAAKKNGLSLTGKSKQISRELLQNADYIVGMTQSHCGTIKQKYPEMKDKLYCFPFDVSDPYGGDIKVYEKSFSEIKKGVDSILKFLSGNPDGNP